MIEVQASIEERSVYVSGERCVCTISVTNVDRGPSGRQQTLAWISAQLHCQCQFNTSLLRMPGRVKTMPSSGRSSDSEKSSGDTCFVPTKGEPGLCSVSTDSSVLACDIRLSPGETRSYTYTEVIPVTAPPSYRGQMVKYSYKITVGTQRINEPTKLLKIPIRVLNLNINQKEERAPLLSPFATDSKSDATSWALHELLASASLRNTRTYNISNKNGAVVRVIIMKEAYRLGEEISGTLDFSAGTIPCQQVSVTLQSEEKIPEECWVNHTRVEATRISHTRHHECSLHTSRVQFMLPVPFTATPQFSTKLVSLSWRIHFEFLLCSQQTPSATGTVAKHRPVKSTSDTLQDCDHRTVGVADLETETLLWDLAIGVLPAHPAQVAGAVATKSPVTVVL